MPAALFRCDAGPELGIGHVVRCRALATAFDALGWRCAFAVTRESAALLSGTRVVVVEFPSREAFHQWYADPEYAGPLAMRLKATTGIALLVDGRE